MQSKIVTKTSGFYSLNVSKSNLYKLKDWPYFISLLLAIIYLITFPQGIFGILLTSFILIFTLFFIFPVTLGVFLIFWGGVIIGNIMTTFGVKYLGYPLFVLIGLVILFYNKNKYYKIKPNWFLPSIWLSITIAVLMFSYSLGPMSKYSVDKLLHFIIKTFIAIIAINYMIKSKRDILWELGILLIFSSLTLYSLQLYLYPIVMPDNILTTAALRMQHFTEEVKIATNEVSMIAAVGLSFLFGTFIKITKGYRKENKKIVIFFSVFILALILINSAGQRVFFIAPFFAFMTLLTKRGNILKNKYAIFVLITLCILIGMLEMLTVTQKIPMFYISGFNRNINWAAAISLIKDAPFLGQGLGGFYIKGYSIPGEAVYPHNLILELLCETGFIGTAVILVFVIFIFIFPKWKQIVYFETLAGARLIPFLTTVFVYSMFSFDLRYSYLLFSIIATMWGYLSIRK